QFWTAVGQAAEAWHLEDVQGLPARHAHHRGGNHQLRPAGLPEGITSFRRRPRTQGRALITCRAIAGGNVAGMMYPNPERAIGDARGLAKNKCRGATFHVNPLAASGAAFLLAVLWFDLMFDVQTRKYVDGTLPAEVLASISAYYRRVTIEAYPMN